MQIEIIINLNLNSIIVWGLKLAILYEFVMFHHHYVLYDRKTVLSCSAPLWNILFNLLTIVADWISFFSVCAYFSGYSQNYLPYINAPPGISGETLIGTLKKIIHNNLFSRFSEQFMHPAMT